MVYYLFGEIKEVEGGFLWQNLAMIKLPLCWTNNFPFCHQSLCLLKTLLSISYQLGWECKRVTLVEAKNLTLLMPSWTLGFLTSLWVDRGSRPCFLNPAHTHTLSLWIWCYLSAAPELTDVFISNVDFVQICKLSPTSSPTELPNVKVPLSSS